MSEIRKWQITPMPEFPHLSVIRDEDGHVIATVDNQYAQAVKDFPALYDASRELFERLSSTRTAWSSASPLGKLENVLKKIDLS